MQLGHVARTFLPGVSWERNEDERKICTALEKVAAEVGTKSITAGSYLEFWMVDYISFTSRPPVAIAYVMQKAPYVFPIIGGRKVEHLHQNIGSLDVALTPEHIQYLESILPFDLGFPASRFVSCGWSW